MKYFIQEMLMPQWSPELTPDEIKAQTLEVVSLIQHIGLTCGITGYDRTILHLEASAVLDAVLFLSKNDLNQAVETLTNLLEQLPSKNIILKLTPNEFHLDILNKDSFATLIISSISSVLRKYFGQQHTEGTIFRLINYILSNLDSLIHIPFCLDHLSILTVLIRSCSDISHIRKSIMHRMYLCLKGGTYKLAIKQADGILGIVIKTMSSEQKLSLFNVISNSVLWDRAECAAMIHLLNCWPKSVSIDSYIIKMVLLLAALLLENITEQSMKVLKVAINQMSFEIWNMVFIPHVVNLVVNYCNNDWEFMARTLAQCVDFAIQRFERKIYVDMNSKLTLTCYPAIALYHSIQKGYLNIMDYQSDIDNLMYSPDSINQNYAVKALSVFNTKKTKLSNWHIDQIKFYLEVSLFSSEEVCYKELRYFLSHMNIQANKMLQRNEDLDSLHNFTEFIGWLYQFSIDGLQSRAVRAVAVACEIFNMVLNVISESHSLKTKYSLNENDHYNKKESAFYKYLVATNNWKYESENVYNILLNEFVESEKVFLEIHGIINKWYEHTDDVSLAMHHTAYSILESKFSKESIIKAEKCILLSLSYSNDYSKVMELFERWKTLIELMLSTSSDDSHVLVLYGFTVCISSVLTKGFIKKSKVMEILICCTHIVKMLLNKESQNLLVIKSIEQTLVTVMNMLYIILKTTKCDEVFVVCFTTANKVMENKCGKSVVCTAADTIHAMCVIALQSISDSPICISQYLEELLHSIYITPEVKMTKIRKHPEHRLIINAIVTAETNSNNICLTYSIVFLLDILLNPAGGNNSKATALHTLQILISNSTIQNETFQYVCQVAIYAMKEFSNSDWNVKNGAIQVLQALVNRLIGQKNNLTQRRRYGVNHLLLFYPDLMDYCYQQLYVRIKSDNCDTVISILALFSESFYTSCTMYSNGSILLVLDSFQNAFMHLMCTNVKVGRFAAKAYSAMSPISYIPSTLSDIVEWIKQNFENINKNIFATIINLFIALLNKYKSFCVLLGKDASDVNNTLLGLKTFLEQYNDEYQYSLFNFLGIISNDVVTSKNKILSILKENDTYDRRIWLNTNLPYVLNNINIEQYPLFLKTCLAHNLSLTLQIHCIESILNRYCDLVKHSFVNCILDICLKAFVKLKARDYVLITFCECILLLLEGTSCYLCSKDLLLQLRKVSNSNLNIYYVSIYISLLSYSFEYIEEDQTFLYNIIKLYICEISSPDSELKQYLASTFIYLYNCINPSQRSHVLQMSFILLLMPECSWQICKFLTHIFNQNLLTTYKALCSLLSVENLNSCLGDIEMTTLFLNKLFVFVNSLDYEFQDIGMFYMKQNDNICSYKQHLLKMLQERIDFINMTT
ncbi:hypothetical protein FQA39_LY04519 [Lamprigera yunnana]|nr:hypothetical protein FQA39_LY04519 [Lamprigera yunnana]